MAKRNNHDFFKTTMTFAALGFGLIALGIMIGLVGVALGNALGTTILVIGIAVTIIGGLLV